MSLPPERGCAREGRIITGGPPHDCRASGLPDDGRAQDRDRRARPAACGASGRARGVIDRAAEIKSATGLPARVPARVEEVVGKVRQAAGEAGLDPALVEQIWRGMIDWSIAREEKVLGPSEADR